MEIIDHDRHTQGGGSMNKKNPSGGGVSPMGVFLCGQSFLSTYAGAMPFFPCVGEGRHYWACPLP